MKKIFTLAFVLFSFTALFAQNRNEGRNNKSYSSQQSSKQIIRSQDKWDDQRSVAYDDRDNDRYQDQRQYEQDRQRQLERDRIAAERERQAQLDRQREIDRLNAEYDRRVREYRENKALNQYERDRRIREVEQERSTKLGSFGTGLAVGVVGAVILGAILAN